MVHIQIINGPNLNLLGTREPTVYGNISLDEVLNKLKIQFPHVQFSYFQSNIEGELVNSIQKANGTANAIILNAAAYSHTSIAIADAVSAISIPVISVHISNIYAREKERHTDLLAAATVGGIYGLGTNGYALAVQAILNLKEE